MKYLYQTALTGLLMLCLNISITSAQTTIITGVMTDSSSKETLPFGSVLIVGTTIGALADDDGKFSIRVEGKQAKIRFEYIGYKTVEKTFTAGSNPVMNVKLAVNTALLKEVTVLGKSRYRNRNNPAVELIRQVIDHKKENQPNAYDFVQYEQYEKISFALSNLSQHFKERRMFRNYQFLFQQQDSATIGGKNILPAYLQEKISQVYLRKNPSSKKQFILAENRAEYDPRFVDNEGLSTYFNRLYEDIDIYANNISIVTNQFLSPVAGNAPTFYKFFIRDTIKTNQPWLIELGFVPRNKTDLLFEGKLFITLDGHYGVQHAYLTVNKSINLNFMRDLEAKLEFERNSDGRYRQAKRTLAMEFALGEKGGGLVGQRVVTFKNYQTNLPVSDSIFKGPNEIIAYSTIDHKNNAYWDKARHIPLDRNEKEIYHNVDTLQTISSFRRTLDITTLLLAGYKSFGPVELGPVNTFYSFNPVEGFRLRVGGRTTPQFNKRMYFETYGAYGFKDRKWKYFFSGSYSLNNKSIYHFPLHYVKFSYQRDTKIPGQELQFVQEDNFLLSFKRGNNDRWLYNDIYKFEYVREFQTKFSYKAGLTQWKQQPAGSLVYEYTDTSIDKKITDRFLNNTEANLELRYAPKEQYYQGKVYRIPIPNKYPVFTLRYNAGIKGVLNGEHSYHNFTGNIARRFFLSQFGYADVTLEGGYIAGKKIPFPLLTIHRANQTYAYQLNSYNLMNFLEFVSDRYASINAEYYLNGFLFNKIPLFKKLKLREVVSFKGLIGNLREHNNPANNPSLYQFAVNPDGSPVTYTLNNKPYFEGSVGIANIFKIFRVDLVKRFNYLDHPDVTEWGIRTRFKLDF